MTLEKIKSYRAICAEIRDIEQALGKEYAGDAVSSASDFPYSKHTVHIEGYPSNSGTLALLKRLSELQSAKVEITSWLDGKSGEERYILVQKFVRGKSNLNIAMQLGYRDEGTIRKKVKKYFGISDFSDFPDV